MSGTPDGQGVVATSRSARDLLASFLHSPFDPATWRAVLAIVLGFAVAIVAFGILSTCFSAGGSLLIWLVGIPLIALGIESARIFARVERWRATFVDRRPLVEHPYRPLPGLPRSPYGPWLRQWAEAEFLDANRWRDVVYVLILFPLAILEFMVALFLWVAAIAFVVAPLVAAGIRAAGAPRFGGEVPVGVAAAMVIGVIVGVVLIPVAASASRGLTTLHRAVVEGLLCVDPTDALRQDVERLRGSRSAALELEASELRRIERDLHDGAQQRLVALAIDLGLAEERIDSDPTSAKTLVAGARAQATQALAELRGLVRGVAPAILVDRGLVAALGAVAGSSPIPTVLGGSLAAGERLPPAVERAAYFVVVESLANAAKHSSATRCEVRLDLDDPGLVAAVRDDGVGGAVLAPGGGLSGLRDRVEALDGSLSISSPVGGPTLVRAEIPIRPG